ncbi:MAG: LysM peptidoglycan-binding domain-containing protein [Steroidobacteraceae bacterium]
MARHDVFKWIAPAAIAVLLLIGGDRAGAQQGGIDRDVIPVAPDAPERYVVQRGDTLWDISAKFLTKPWYWPEIWYVNPEVANPHLIYPGDVLVLTWVDGRPRLALEQGSDLRLSPRVREEPLSEAIRAIPWQLIEAFVSRPTVLAEEQVKAAPYLVAGLEGREISGPGDTVYARRADQARAGASWLVYEPGQDITDPETGDLLGRHGVYAATASVTRQGDPASLRILEAVRETGPGLILLQPAAPPPLDFIPRAPESAVEGVVVTAATPQTAVGQFDVVVINRGARHGLEPGHVLSAWNRGIEVRDDMANAVSSRVRLPDEQSGRLMVVQVFDRMSFALVLDASRDIAAGDPVRNP